MKQILFCITLLILLTGCEKQVSQGAYNELKSNYEKLESMNIELENQLESLNSEYNSQENDSAGDKELDNEIFLSTLTGATKIDRQYYSNYIADDIMQIIFLAQNDARTELSYIENGLTENTSTIKLLCETYGIKYLYIKSIDEVSKNTLFELLFDLSGDGKVTMSIGLDYINDLQ